MHYLGLELKIYVINRFRSSKSLGHVVSSTCFKVMNLASSIYILFWVLSL